MTRQKRRHRPKVEVTCERCGNKFERPASLVSGHNFCSRACYLADVRAGKGKAKAMKKGAGG